MLEEFLKKLTHNGETKPFYVTSEFWVFVGIVLTASLNLLPTGNPEVRTAVVAAAAVAYKVSRGLAKAGVKPPEGA